MNQAEARRQFRTMMARAEYDIELDRTALLIAAEEYPHLQIETYLRQLDHFAEEFRSQRQISCQPDEQIEQLSEYLFETLGFSGNTADYYDVRNSFLNEVMDRRMGIPITLSLVYIEVARRLKMPVYGVGMPGHFLVKYRDLEREILIDPFHRGRILSLEDCEELFDEMYEGRMSFRLTFVNEVSCKHLLARLLNNLKSIYGRVPDHHKTLAVIERLLMISPGLATELRDRGRTLANLGRYSQALADLSEYLRQESDAEDAAKVKEELSEIRQRMARLN
jgi:regulator of sirC expression with transglutaminase-like and TPR domain